MKTLILILCGIVLLAISGCCSTESKISMENNAVLLDVRTPEEHKSGYLEGAVLLPLAELESRAGDSTTLRMSIKGARDAILDVLTSYPSIRDQRILSDKGGVVELELELPKGLDIRDDLFFAMAARRCAVIHVEQSGSNLEQVFLSLTDKTQGTPGKRALREKKRREKLLGNVKETPVAPKEQQEDEQDGGDD